jgi:hypothetical protein
MPSLDRQVRLSCAWQALGLPEISRVYVRTLHQTCTRRVAMMGTCAGSCLSEGGRKSGGSVTRYQLRYTYGAPAKLISESTTDIMLNGISFKSKSTTLNRLYTGFRNAYRGQRTGPCTKGRRSSRTQAALGGFAGPANRSHLYPQNNEKWKASYADQGALLEPELRTGLAAPRAAQLGGRWPNFLLLLGQSNASARSAGCSALRAFAMGDQKSFGFLEQIGGTEGCRLGHIFVRQFPDAGGGGNLGK